MKKFNFLIYHGVEVALASSVPLPAPLPKIDDSEAVCLTLILLFSLQVSLHITQSHPLA